MRRSLSLGLLLVGFSAVPAVAGHVGGVHVSGSHPHFARHFNRFNGFNGFSGGFNGSFGAFGFNSFNRFGRGFGSQWGWGWGLSDWDSWDGWPGVGGAPGTIIVLAGGPPAAYAPPPATPAQATVTTEAGVTVFRGPGSHHLR